MGLFNDNFITCSVIYLSLDVIDETASHIFVIYSKKAGVNGKPFIRYFLPYMPTPIALFSTVNAKPQLRHSLQ
jgi:hypothetical protein